VSKDKETIHVHVNVTRIHGRDAWVGVDWRTVNSGRPAVDDWLGVFAPAGSITSKRSTINYKW
jgi:hypothetical protein